MKRILIMAAACLCLASCGSSASYSWKCFQTDGHRTGVTASSADNVTEAMGKMDGTVYVSPNGTRFESGATPELASLIIDAQPKMAEVKKVIGYAPEAMMRREPECGLYDFAVDALMAKAGEVFGEKMDVGLMNVGGVRCDIPQGDVQLDDILSMFPFKNYVTLVKLSGKRLRELYGQMAERHPEIIGGAKIVIENHKLVSAEVGGEPIDDDRIYNLASIDFLLNGGDHIWLSRGVESYIVSDFLVIDAILPAVCAYAEAGKPFTYKTDGRVIVKNEN